MEARTRGLIRIGAVVAFTLALVYVVHLGGLVMATQHAARAEARLGAENVALRQSVEALETAAVEAGSDAYVERWAREDRKWALPGDRPVAPVEATPPATGGDAPSGDGSGDAWGRLRRWLGGG